MFEINFNTLWTLTFFFYIFYLIFICALVLYILPQIQNWTLSYFFKSTSKYFYQNGRDLYYFLLTFIFIILISNYVWSSYTLTIWFGHLIYGALQKKFILLISLLFITYLIYTSSFFILGSQEINDYYITCVNFYAWMILLFLSNTLFSVIFLIEILSTLILLLTITSLFARTFESANVIFDWTSKNSLQPALIYFKGLFLFFWVSLLSSLSLFLFLIFFYLQFFTFDCTNTEFFIIYLTKAFEKALVFNSLLSWIFLIFCVFLKCGLVPFYFWKPIFFRSLTTHALFFYIVFFYFFICLFFILFFFLILNELLYLFGFVFTCFLFIGLISLFSLLCEVHYIKFFLAFSSILNTLFVFLILSTDSGDHFIFFI